MPSKRQARQPRNATRQVEQFRARRYPYASQPHVGLREHADLDARRCAAAESCCAANRLSSDTVTRVRRATAIRRSSFARPITGKATSISGGAAASITSASPTFATVRPAAPKSS